MKKLLIALMLVACSTAYADKIYTCNVGGSTVYQGKPCAGSKELNQQVKENQKRYTDQKNQAAKEQAEWNSKNKPSVGMSAKQAENSTWGYPDKVNKTTTANNVFEQWVYRLNHGRSRYLNFINGKLSSITE